MQQAILHTLKERQFQHTFILCFLGGFSALKYVTSMSRNPVAPVGWELRSDIVSRIDNAIEINHAHHDGAMIFTRPQGHYELHGWSFRLHPPKSPVTPEPNRGSAFESCLAMSCVRDVDFVILGSRSKLIKFEAGRMHHYD